MNKLFFLILILGSLSVSAQDFIGYKVYGSAVESQSDVNDIVLEFEKLKANEDYEVEIDLCVVYGDGTSKFDTRLDRFLESAGYSIELEGIYGSYGDHMFQVRDIKSDSYLGSFNGIYSCEN